MLTIIPPNLLRTRLLRLLCWLIKISEKCYLHHDFQLLGTVSNIPNPPRNWKASRQFPQLQLERHSTTLCPYEESFIVATLYKGNEIPGLKHLSNDLEMTYDSQQTPSDSVLYRTIPSSRPTDGILYGKILGKTPTDAVPHTFSSY